jgi:hypothetical protein
VLDGWRFLPTGNRATGPFESVAALCMAGAKLAY